MPGKRNLDTLSVNYRDGRYLPKSLKQQFFLEEGRDVGCTVPQNTFFINISRERERKIRISYKTISRYLVKSALIKRSIRKTNVII